MKHLLMFSAAAALHLSMVSCVTRTPVVATADTAVHGGCYNAEPDFKRLVSEQATREQVEEFIGRSARRISDEKALRAAARSELSPKNLALFRRYRSALYGEMECDNQILAFFDAAGKLVGFQSM
jgi:hypothetical protein